MEYFDELYIVRHPPVTLAQWESLIAQRADFTLPDRSLDCHIYIGDVELDAANVYIWLGHSSGQQLPVQITQGRLYFPGIDSETVSFVHHLALQLDACVVQKVHPMNVAAAEVLV
ncbi:hypothetical protein GJ700_29650 [Duganella sp. FT92W]|uniref:Uncharacterized protein n=1 Tax=Pseudoduganella rivuli TaxID=2666085 RepID=A0A7X2LUQ0_9BURK|nr:hypothetical protein [Pseudoduganella rivuli]MRV75885.1 hypothetical protein [Pseudoduganella rivuli]